MQLLRSALGLVTAGSLAILPGCAPSYSPNTYAAAAAQQASKVELGVVIGVRQVQISADASLGTVTGAAAGGIAGSTVNDNGTVKALSALGGSVLGGLVGSGVQHAEGDTIAFEYIVREGDASLVSVTQRDKAPLPIGERVLVIAGKQARIVPDYTVAVPSPKPSATALHSVKPRPADAQVAAGTATVVPHPEAASSGVAAQTVVADPPSSSSGTAAGGSTSHSAAAGGGTAASAANAAETAVFAAPLDNPDDPAAAAAEQGKPVSAGTVRVPPATGAAAPNAAGGDTAASTPAGTTAGSDTP
jgi:outer membrane lipoprotein SlyB